MGDVFHQSNANQSATNQQIGISTRDIGGNQIVIGHGAVQGGGSLTVQSLDPAALGVAAQAVHDALAANTETSLSAFHTFQHALSVTGETTGGALQLAASGAGSGAQVAPLLTQGGIAGIDPTTLLIIAAAGGGLLLLLFALKR